MAELTSPSAGVDIAASWGQGVADRLNAYGCVLFRTATQSINDSTDTAITFPTGSMTEELDTDGFHSGATNTSRITIPTGGDGWYLIGANVAFDVDADGRRAIWIEVDGSAGSGTSILNSNQASFTTDAARLSISGVTLLAAAQYLTLNVRHNAGAATNVLANGYSVRFWCVRLWKT